jgi:hypothetical protein
MIEKERSMPMQLQQLEALLRRLPESHPKRKNVQADYVKRMAGYRGEQSVDYQLSLLPQQNYMIMHDLRLFDGSHYFQLDTLILTTKFILFLEVKNIAGTLFFDSEFNQLVRTIDNKTEGLPNPVLQIYRQQVQLDKVIQTSLPIESLIIISNPHTIIKTSSSDNPISKKIIHSANLIQRINELDHIYKLHMLKMTELYKLKQKIMSSYRPAKSNMLKYYQLSTEDLQKGVQCPKCSIFPMVKMRRTWKCTQCYATSPDAHIQAMRDCALLVNTSVANRDIKEFLQLHSSDTTKKLLRKLNVPYEGEGRARKYTLTFEESPR